MSETLTIRTNNVARDVLYWWELTDKERAEFDYIDSESKQSESSFFRYRGNVYDLGEFSYTGGMPEFSPLRKWDGYQSDSFFSGITVRYCQNYERVIVGFFYC